MVNNWLDIIQHYLLPPTCILCGNPGFACKDICLPCFNNLSKNNYCCYRCAEIFPTAQTQPQLCGQCIRHSPAFDESHAPFIYQHSIRYLVSQLKFNRQYKNARLLGSLLADHLEKTAELPELIIPMPLHRRRFQQRGFNQCTEIAQIVSKQLAIPIDKKSCIRQYDTAHQINLNAKQRQRNIKNAFLLIQPLKVSHVAILDDVMTTGATVNELARVLKKSSVDRVDIWVCARA